MPVCKCQLSCIVTLILSCKINPYIQPHKAFSGVITSESCRYRSEVENHRMDCISPYQQRYKNSFRISHSAYNPLCEVAWITAVPFPSALTVPISSTVTTSLRFIIAAYLATIGIYLRLIKSSVIHYSGIPRQKNLIFLTKQKPPGKDWLHLTTIL